MNKAELLLKYLPMAPVGPVFEVGCLRSEFESEEDGYSTLYLLNYCTNNDINFISIDNDKDTVELAKKVLNQHRLDEERILLGDGAETIKKLDRNISFLYLDSHKDPVYTLEQYKAACLNKGAILIIDDSQPIERWQFGKATLVKNVFDKYKVEYKIITTLPGYSALIAIMPQRKPSGKLIWEQ